MAKAVDLIADYKPGDRLSAEDLQAIVDFVKRFSHVNGHNDQGQTAQRYKASSKSNEILHYLNSTGAAMPKFSVFNPSGTPAAFSDPPFGDMDVIGVTGPGSPFVYLTNDSLEIPDTAQAEVRIIPFDQPTLLRVNPSFVPAVWEPCGVEFETNWLCSSRFGFVCLSEETTVDGEGTYIWAARTREPIKVVGEAYGTITAYNSITGVLGTGLMKVKYRNPAASQALALAKAPQAKATPLLATVWNKGLAVADLAIISATDTLGIGLVLDATESAEIVYFQLSADKLIATQPVTAKILSFNGTTWVDSGVTINLYDSYYNSPGFFTGKSGVDRGWAKLRKRAVSSGNDDYELLWMSGPAHVVRFTLTQNRTFAGTAEARTATINETMLYGHDQLAPASVYFNTGMFPHALTGATGFAVYNDRQRRYDVVQCDQLCLRGTALVNNASHLCGSSTVAVDNFVVTSHYPFSQKPDGVAGFSSGGTSGTASNPRAHYGVDNDPIDLEYNKATNTFDIYDIVQKVQTVVTDIQVSGFTLQKKTRSVAIESCAAESAFTTFHTGGECP